MPLEPPSLLVGHHACAPLSRYLFRPGRPVRSAEHGHVAPDVPPKPRRAVCGACSGGEMPCQRHVTPHNPIRFETTVDMPRQRSVRHTLRARSDVPKVVPRRIRRAVWLSALVRVVWTRADMMSTRRSTTPLPQATVGPGGKSPSARGLPHPSPWPPFASCWPTAGHRLRLRCPGRFSSVIRRGNAKAHLLHTQCIYG